MVQPNISFGTLFGIFFFIEFAAFGLGYAISLLFSQENAPVAGIVLTFAFCVCSGISPRLKAFKLTQRIRHVTRHTEPKGLPVHCNGVLSLLCNDTVAQGVELRVPLATYQVVYLWLDLL
jgi:hypothetical protein